LLELLCAAFAANAFTLFADQAATFGAAFGTASNLFLGTWTENHRSFLFSALFQRSVVTWLESRKIAAGGWKFNRT